ncbi:hypothetical protein [Microbacterium sp. MMO-10]|uniref:hypothetical protein n=1 Tax=Microbacterium sp. MMO-10 TaxID=3081272 RepID=UPI0030193802
MYMSTDTLAVIGSGIGGLLTLGIAMFAGFAWVIRRMDAMEHRLIVRMDSGDQRLDEKIDAVEHKLSQKIDTVDQRLSRKIDAVDQRLSRKLDALEHEFTEVKIVVARIEGPRPRLFVER